MFLLSLTNLRLIRSKHCYTFFHMIVPGYFGTSFCDRFGLEKAHRHFAFCDAYYYIQRMADLSSVFADFFIYKIKKVVNFLQLLLLN